MTDITSLEHARALDQKDPLAGFRAKYHMPKHKGKEVYYFCGNSLGLQPKQTRKAIEQELEDWASLGVEGHFEATNPWFSYHHFVEPATRELVGAVEKEVVVMNALTVNLNLLMVSFYRPEGKRRKIIMEADAFPSDHYAVQQQVLFHGGDPQQDVILLKNREGEHHLRTADILTAITDNAQETALVLLGGVNYKTGQLFDMEAITQHAQKLGMTVGFDLAHAVGNVPLKLHDWGVDFATWCSYKYLNAGPGGVSGVFVHKRHANKPDLPRFAGWWGHDEDNRFLMDSAFSPMEGAEGWQMSNAPVLAMAAYKASTALFQEAGMDALREKSLALTGYLEQLLQRRCSDSIAILTPSNPSERGCQLSLACLTEQPSGKVIFNFLKEQGVIADWREPNVIRVAPVPMYNRFEDVWHLVDFICRAIESAN